MGEQTLRADAEMDRQAFLTPTGSDILVNAVQYLDRSIVVVNDGAVSSYAERSRAQARAQLRDAALDVLAAAITAGDADVAMVIIARAVGVSRQTLYAEFGSREGLLTALADRENAVVLAQVAATLTAHDDLVEAVAAAAETALRSAADNVLHKALLTGDPATAGIVVGHTEPLLQRALTQLTAVITARFPMLDPVDTDLLADVVVRVVQSHLTWPTEPVETTVARIRRLVERYLAGGPAGTDRVLAPVPSPEVRP